MFSHKESTTTADVKVDAPLLEVDHLSVGFQRGRHVTWAVRDASLAIHPGETVGIVGESGSGKSLTALSMLKMTEARGAIVEGDIRFQGESILRRSDRALRSVRGAKISVVFQDPMSSLNPVMRIKTQFAEAIRAHRSASSGECERIAVELLEEVGIPGARNRVDQYPHEFSGGMRQRVAIALALCNDPDLLIADEPTTALDVTVQAQILELLGRLNEKRGKAILLISHNLSVVSKVCSRVVVMYAGHVVEDAPAGALFRRPLHPYTGGLLRSIAGLSGDRSHDLAVIPGSPPSGGSTFQACSFAGRCPYAEPHCHEEAPPLEKVGEARFSACWVAQRDPEKSNFDWAAHDRSQRAVADIAGSDRQLLSVRDLRVRFAARRRGSRRDLVAVDGVSLEIGRGETLGLVGESGCGKSTLAKAIVGAVPVSDGQVVFDGVDYAGPESDIRRLRRQVQYVFQDPRAALNPRMTVGALLEEPLRLRGLRSDTDAEMDRLLGLVGLTRDLAPRRPRELSGGQRQRVLLARALAVNPQVLILDEPVSALDVSLQAQIVNLLAELQVKLGLSYLFISHDLAVVRHLSDRIAVMYLGTIVEEGHAEKICAEPRHPYTASLLSAVPDVSSVAGERIILRGDAPDPANPPSGCRFHDRCPIGPMFRSDREICKTVTPELTDSASGSRAACHFSDEMWSNLEEESHRQTVTPV